jgi:hypothetical protein
MKIRIECDHTEMSLAAVGSLFSSLSMIRDGLVIATQGDAFLLLNKLSETRKFPSFLKFSGTTNNFESSAVLAALGRTARKGEIFSHSQTDLEILDSVLRRHTRDDGLKVERLEPGSVITVIKDAIKAGYDQLVKTVPQMGAELKAKRPLTPAIVRGIPRITTIPESDFHVGVGIVTVGTLGLERALQQLRATGMSVEEENPEPLKVRAAGRR